MKTKLNCEIKSNFAKILFYSILLTKNYFLAYYRTFFSRSKFLKGLFLKCVLQ